MADIVLVAPPEAENDIPPMEEDTYPARCFAIVKAGTIHSDLYDKDQSLIYFGFEFPTEMITLGKSLEPRVIWSTGYTESLNKKANLRKMLETWRGKQFTDNELKGFSLKKILGAPCMASVVQTPAVSGGRIYNNIVSMVKIPKGYHVDEIKDEFIFNAAAPDEDLSKVDDLQVPNWLKEKIKASLEYQAYVNGPAPETKVSDAEAYAPISADEEDLPF